MNTVFTYLFTYSRLYSQILPLRALRGRGHLAKDHSGVEVTGPAEPRGRGGRGFWAQRAWGAPEGDGALNLMKLPCWVLDVLGPRDPFAPAGLLLWNESIVLCRCHGCTLQGDARFPAPHAHRWRTVSPSGGSQPVPLMSDFNGFEMGRLGKL